MRARLVPLLLTPLLIALAAPTARAQGAESIEIVSLLSGADVVPNKVLTGAFGIATLTLNEQSREATFDVTFFNLPTGLSGAHVHVGAPGVGGPVLFDLRPTPRQAGDVNLTGNLSTVNLSGHAELGIRDIDDALQSIVGLATYIDAHTDGNPDGEIRGVLLPSMSNSTAALARSLLLQSAGRQRR